MLRALFVFTVATFLTLTLCAVVLQTTNVDPPYWAWILTYIATYLLIYKLTGSFNED